MNLFILDVQSNGIYAVMKTDIPDAKAAFASIDEYYSYQETRDSLWRCFRTPWERLSWGIAEERLYNFIQRHNDIRNEYAVLNGTERDCRFFNLTIKAHGALVVNNGKFYLSMEASERFA